jgi:Lectin C-type domain
MTWSDAWNYCCSFDMKLVSVETTMRHACLSKFAKSLNFCHFYSCYSLKSNAGYDPVVKIEHWTSVTDEGSAGNFMWCSNKTFLDMKYVNWKSGQPNNADGHCAFVQFSEKSANQSTFSMGDCTQKRKFICEVSNMSLTLYKS